MRFTFFCLLFILTGRFAGYAQPDTISPKSNPSLNYNNLQLPDSAALAKAYRQKVIEDSIAMFYLMPDSLRENQLVSGILKNNLDSIFSHANTSARQKALIKTGRPRNQREGWIIWVIVGLLIYTAMLNLFLSKDIKNVIQSFYNKQALSQLDKEGGPVNSWAFVGLFLLFCLTAGLVLYQFTLYKNVYYNINGLQLFFTLSVGVSILFALKFIALKFIGFVFDANRLVSQYIAVLNLTYFNIAFVLLSVAVCFSLLANQFIQPLLILTLALIAVIFTWQYLRNSVNIISDIRFHKFYLFIYLCALEICPILILIKALDI
jgi:hypothetical protein